MIDVDYNEYKETLAENMKLIVENHRLEEVEKEHQKLNGELREEIERLNKIRQQVIDELFDLKNMIYKPETREINFDVQNKISSIIKILGSDKE